MTSNLFSYDKGKVLQALRYHFITRKEIKIMMILVNVFSIVSATLFFFKKITPLAFLVSAVLWFALMILFWFLLPKMIYKKAQTFQDKFKAILSTDEFALENERGRKGWAWQEFSTFMESPHFFHLYFNSRSFFIVPKDAFEGDNLHEARNIFKEKIKAN
jgi:hypothetical protein